MCWSVYSSCFVWYKGSRTSDCARDSTHLRARWPDYCNCPELGGTVPIFTALSRSSPCLSGRICAVVKKNGLQQSNESWTTGLWYSVLFSTAYMSVYCCFKHRLVTGKRSRVNTSGRVYWTEPYAHAHLVVRAYVSKPSGRLRPMLLSLYTSGYAQDLFLPTYYTKPLVRSEYQLFLQNNCGASSKLFCRIERLRGRRCTFGRRIWQQQWTGGVLQRGGMGCSVWRWLE